MSAPVTPQQPDLPPPTHSNPPRGRYLARLALLALGVVYGDIGTSPLYALREAFHGQHGIPVTAGNVLGVLSLVFWSLILIVTVKYHVVIIRADNKGEGGVLALMALVNGRRVARGLSPRRVMIARSRMHKSMFEMTGVELKKDREWLKNLDKQSHSTN